MTFLKNALIGGLMLATALPMIAPVAAQAQSRGELHRDRQDIREERRELRDARRYGNARDVREERRDVREARQEYREDLSDYRRYRASNRNAFRGNRFAANFRHQNFRPGAHIAANYYAPRYVVNDYHGYRLPRPGANRIWVRHYDDVLLINTRSGRVVRVIPNFYY